MKTAIVTGASAGIGRATALALARAGYDVGLTARRHDELREVASAVEHAGRRAFVAVADVAVADQLTAALDDLRGRLSGCDVLVCNAGMPGGGPFADVPLERIERVIDVNLLGVARSIHAVLPQMLAKRSGTIVCVASVAGRIAVPGAAVYSATKFGVAGLCDALRVELRGSGVHVCLVNPGPVRTASWPHTGVPQMFLATPEQVATALVAAVADRRRQVTLPRYYRAVEILGAVAPRLYDALLARYASGTSRRPAT